MCFNPGYLRTPTGALKIIEIICVSIAFGIFRGVRYAHFGNEDTDYFACGVLVAAIIITPLLLLCYLMGRLEIQKTMLETFINFLFFVFLLAAGSVALHTWEPYSYKVKGGGSTLAMGIFTIFAAVAYLADSFFACYNQREMNEPWRSQDGPPSRKFWEPPFWDRCRRDSNRWGNTRQNGTDQWQPSRYEMNKNPVNPPQHFEPTRYEPYRYGPQSYDTNRYDSNRYGPNKYESKQFESVTKLEPNKYDPTKYEPKKHEPTKSKAPYWLSEESSLKCIESCMLIGKKMEYPESYAIMTKTSLVKMYDQDSGVDTEITNKMLQYR
ncbi:unnamed protein product [Meganyctiphanes norvegica]|uniref:MARVEL domain-containing protein n=1 Tax=Meganyctiphanes norvegica TaxID=48144 RepID=A0AAV2SFW9_MEGNR